MFKSKEAIIPLRRSELISPNGVGSITTNSDGINMMPGALDTWYEELEIDDFIIVEERLKDIFKIDEFRLPPDYRKAHNRFTNEVNIEAHIPMLRFPNYYYCSHCKVLSRENDFINDSKIECEVCNNRFAKLIQVPLIVACENGHIDDFPWNEWTHNDINSKCEGPLKLISTGGATLSTMKVKCTKCYAQRTLKGLTTRDSSMLSQGFSNQEIYKCSGRKPWFGSKYPNDSECKYEPQPILKNATNGYYPQVLNAIYIPMKSQSDINKILDIFEKDPIKKKIKRYINHFPMEETIESLQEEPLLEEFEMDLLEEAVIIFKNGKLYTQLEDKDYDLKLKEYDFLSSKSSIQNDKLKVIPEYINTEEDDSLKKLGISQINLVSKLIETRVLYGFSRIIEPISISNNPLDIVKEGKKKLFMYPDNHKWLPAYQVFGEGIYIEFDDNLLSDWEEKYYHSRRFGQLKKRVIDASDNGVEVKDGISPRYVFLHTLAHLFIQEVVLSSGYSSSSLKERIYCGPNNNSSMNGFLIYTASGDSEGTMGGLVRLGSISSIKKIIENIIEKARWCSADPVCNEIGMEKGQGRDYLNGAACHNCSYVSEISCEEFNKYLDRGLIASYEKTEDFKSFFEFSKSQL